MLYDQTAELTNVAHIVEVGPCQVLANAFRCRFRGRYSIWWMEQVIFRLHMGESNGQQLFDLIGEDNDAGTLFQVSSMKVVYSAEVRLQLRIGFCPQTTYCR